MTRAQLTAKIIEYTRLHPGRAQTYAKMGTDYHEARRVFSLTTSDEHNIYDVLRTRGILVDGYALSDTGKRIRCWFVPEDAPLSGLSRTRLDAIGTARRGAAK